MKSKSERYDIFIHRFRACSLYLLSLLNINFTREYLALLPQGLPFPSLPQHQVIKAVLRSEFGDVISKTLTLLPSLEMKREKERQSCREQHDAAVSGAHQTREEYVQSWPQVILRDIMYECLNSYYNSTQWNMPQVCPVCSRWQHAVEMHGIVLGSDEEIPAYLQILRNEDKSLFSEDEFRFMDSHLDRLMLDPDGLQVNEEHTTLHVCHPCYGYLSQSLMPRCTLANKLYRGHLPNEFKDLIWIKEWVCAKFSNTALVTHLYQSYDPSQPTVFHSNTCAHEVNVVLMARVLPCAPADVNGLLSIVFIGL